MIIKKADMPTDCIKYVRAISPEHATFHWDKAKPGVQYYMDCDYNGYVKHYPDMHTMAQLKKLEREYKKYGITITVYTHIEPWSGSF